MIWAWAYAPHPYEGGTPLWVKIFLGTILVLTILWVWSISRKG